MRRRAAALGVAPPGMADAADEQLVARVFAGDHSALDELLERYRNFVRSKARSYFLVGADREDVVQEGMIGLYKAVRDYDLRRQVTFRAFAECCVTRQIITAVKAATRHKHGPLNSYVSLHLPTHDNDPDRELIDSFVSHAVDPAERVVSSSELERLERYCSRILSDLEAQVLERYVDGQTYSEIAVELDRHVKSIDNALQRIKRKLDCYLQERRLEEAV